MSFMTFGCEGKNERNDIEAQAQEVAFDSLKAWEEFEGQLRFRYAYLDRDDFDVDQQLAHSKSLALKATNQLQFRRILQQTSYAFTDPHFIVGPFEDIGSNVIPTSADLTVRVDRNKILINDVRAGSAAQKAGIRPNWEVVSVNQLEISKEIRRILGDVVDNPTPKQLKYAAMLAVNGPRKAKRNIVFETGQGIKEIELPSPREFALKVSAMPILESVKVGGVDIIRINNSLGNNDLIHEFDRAVRVLGDSSGLIIDLRNTPSGGNTEVGRSIIGHFVNETRGYQIHEIPSLEREFTVPRRFIEQVLPREPYFDPKKVVVLGGPWTGSMGEGVVIGLHGAAGIYTIGSDMGDLLGALRNIELPYSNSKLDLADEALFHVDGTPRENFVADLPLPRTDTDFAGEDPALAAAIEYLSGI